MTTDAKQIQWAIEQWREAAKTGTEQSKITCIRAAKSLELELRHGEPYCVCHLNKLKDCPAQSQNRHKIR